VSAVRGIRLAAAAAGIRYKNRDDLLVIELAEGGTCAAVFTRNAFCAAPVTVAREHLAKGPVRYLLINAGNANAGTGAPGLRAARETCRLLAGMAGCAMSQVLPFSTGVIGQDLPVDPFAQAIPGLLSGLTEDNWPRAARAIMTTDSVSKEAVSPGDGFVVGGMAKGAGMIRPGMATMLAVITTDAIVGGSTLGDVLRMAADASFNSLNIDGCESTNDSVILLASGASGVEPTRHELETAVTAVCADLAIQMARDAEGASRVVTIDVDGALDAAEARYLGRLIADSALVRASFYGGDVNWGRIIGALGTAEVTLDMSSIDLAYQGVTVFGGGLGVPHDEAALLAACASGDLALHLVLGRGSGRATVVTTDLTPEYVIFNGERS